MLAVLILGSTGAYGQETTASIQGEVSDVEGETLPGANVVAVHVPSGTEYGTSTKANGQYKLDNLRVGGPYQITVSFVGYQSKREEGVSLSLGETRRLDFELREQTEEIEEIEVVAKRTGVVSTETGIGTAINDAQIDATPTQGRKLADITRLVPQSYVGNDDDDGPAVSFAGQNTDFNSIFIDGAVSNDVFGLSAQGTDGGQTGATPISLSALEAFNVDISPYEVTQSGFTGAAINAVTKSGTNEFKGSFEYFRRGDGLSQQSAAFGSNRYVGTLGGPIIKNKLFFFANVDIRRSETPQPLQTDYQGRNLDLKGNSNNNELDGVDEIRSFVRKNTGYDPGGFGTRNTTVESNKFLGKLDYNVNENHRLTARYFFNSTKNVDQFQSTRFGVNFGNSAEVFPNDTHNFMLQWNGDFGKQISTKTTATYKNVEDDRGVRGEPFPHMTIADGPAEIDLGSELFSQVNFLEQDVATFSNKTDISLGNHTLTVGTHNEFYDITNKFVVFSPGLYDFRTPEAFAKTICDYAQRNPDRTANGGPSATCNAMFSPSQMQPDNFFLHGYSLVDDNPSTSDFESIANDNTDLAGAFQAIQLGFYAQDKWQVSDQFDVTYGLRVNFPKILDDPEMASDANEATLYGTDFGNSNFDGPSVSNFYDLKGARAGQTPKWRAMWEPRVGFNWDVFGDQSTKIRGGAGVFTSRLPFVWPASMFTTNGVSSDVVAGLGLELRRPSNHLTRPEPGNTGFFFGGGGVDPKKITPTGGLHIMQDDFMYPRVLRTSLGIDRELPFGLVGTLEGQFSEKLQGIVVENVNLRPSNETMDGPDNRPIYAYSVDGFTNALDPGGKGLIDDRYGEGILRVRNTSKGYSYNLTAELEKEPAQLWSGTLSGSVSYSYGDAYAINSYGGDTVGSLWDENEHVNGTNNLELARSEFSQGHRIQVSANWRQEFGDNFALTTSLFYTGVSGRPFSYTIGSSQAFNDGAATVMIGDEGGPPLFYVPSSVSKLNIKGPITDDDGNVLRTVQEQRDDLKRFLGNVSYLDDNRGGYTERNADRTPFEGVVDLKFSFEVLAEALGRQQGVNVNLNIFNFSALLGETMNDLGAGFGKTWGDRYVGVGSFNVVNFAGYVDPKGNDNDPNNNFVPQYKSGLGTGDNVIRDKEDILTKETAGNTYSSFYQVQLGLKYTF